MSVLDWAIQNDLKQGARLENKRSSLPNECDDCGTRRAGHAADKSALPGAS
jgi:hypothetical protein